MTVTLALTVMCNKLLQFCTTRFHMTLKPLCNFCIFIYPALKIIYVTSCETSLVCLPHTGEKTSAGLAPPSASAQFLWLPCCIRDLSVGLGFHRLCAMRTNQQIGWICPPGSRQVAHALHRVKQCEVVDASGLPTLVERAVGYAFKNSSIKRPSYMCTQSCDDHLPGQDLLICLNPLLTPYLAYELLLRKLDLAFLTGRLGRLCTTWSQNCYL